MSKIADIGEKIVQGVTEGYKMIETGVTQGYKKIETDVVEGFEKVTDECVEVLFAREGETLEQTKARLSGNQPDTADTTEKE